MHIDIISKQEELVQLRERWDELYQRDSEAQFFLSWIFLSTYLRRFEGSWFVLAARNGPTGSPYVALLPLRLRTRMNKGSGQFYNEFNMGGSYAADYTGIICDPECAEAAIAALAKHLKKMHWTRLHLENLRMSDDRLRCLLRHLQDERLSFRQLSRVNKIDNTNNCKCPSVQLSDTWDDYLAQNISPGTRQKIRRFLRRADSGEEFRITLADKSSIERDLDTLLELWRKKWAERKGPLTAGLVRSNRTLYKHGFESGTLFLPVLWQYDKPIAALATFLDPVKKTMFSHCAIRDESVDVPSAGRVLHAYSIRYGIEHGFRTYDFLRGDEPYKYSFGARDTLIRCALVQTRTGRNLGERIDVRSIPAAFREATAFHKKGAFLQAENLYRQILASEPNHAPSLYGFGQFVAAKGDHRSAFKAFETLSLVTPESAKVWLRLGTALRALDDHAGAIDALGKAVELDPKSADARYGLGLSLLKLKRTDEAVAALAAVAQLSTEDPREKIIRQRALHSLSELKRHQANRLIEQRIKSDGPGVVGPPTDIYFTVWWPGLAEARTLLHHRRSVKLN
jgi:CelD/BcsL family acetyltransferase involved in cellulose biosynthesis